MKQSKMKLIAGILVLACIITALYFIYSKTHTDAPGETDITEVMPEEAVKERGDKSVLSAPVQPTFVAYSNSGLTLKAPTQLSSADQKTYIAKIEQDQKKIEAFTANSARTDIVDAFFILSADQQLLGDYAGAKLSLEKALAYGVDGNLLQTYATLLLNMGSKEGALKYIDQAILSNSAVQNYWRTKIEITGSLKGGDKALMNALYEKAITATNNHIDMITFYARYLSDTEQYEKANVYWQKAITINPAGKDSYQKEIDSISGKIR